MQPQIKKPPSDEEEDLESLRLAALQSLKRPAPVNNLTSAPNNNNTKSYKKPHKRGRGCHSNTRNRNGVFGSRIRNSTLIAVPTIETDTFETSTKKVPESTSRLIRPQDRYTKQVVTEEKSESCSKFDRYKDSESESESDSEDVTESGVKLERASSLEALMQELENEIKRDTKTVEAPKNKQIKKVPRIVEEDVKPIVNENDNQPVKDTRPEVVPKLPISTKSAPEIPPVIYPNTQVPFAHNQFANFNASNAQFDSHMTYNFPPVNSIEGIKPKYYERPLSPLTFDTGVFNTITAPLSPRSAAFVLQNREIIERRKKSPRRSYSRSPSPRYRRSKSRSTSPVRPRTSPGSCNSTRKLQSYKRSPPSRYTSPKRRRRSPTVRANFRSTSPYREIEPKEHVQSRGISLSLSPSPERFASPDLVEDKKVDHSILEARRKKFQSDAIPTEGIIRLKPKVDQSEQLMDVDKDEENENSSIVVDTSPNVKTETQPSDDNYIDFNLKVNDLFSDEDSDSENEGRFKSKSTNLPTNEQTEYSRKEKSKDVLRSKRSTKYENDAKSAKRETDSSSKVTSSKHKSHLSSLENRKIEIKIRNPGKYEVENESDGRIKDKKTHSRKVEVTSSAMSNQVHSDSEENEIDINNEGSGDLRAQLSRKRAKRQQVPKIENIPSRLLQNALQSAVFKKIKKVKSKKKERDLSPLDNMEDNYLAAKLRTVKNGCGVADINCSITIKDRKVRLLHCDSETITTASDGKLPIHLRLGIPGSADAFNESKSPTKNFGKRSKNRAKYEQV